MEALLTLLYLALLFCVAALPYLIYLAIQALKIYIAKNAPAQSMPVVSCEDVENRKLDKKG
jgi:hypothetical protein